MPRTQNPLHERYASREMAALFTAEHRFRTWRRIWIALAEAQRELGLEISREQIAALKAVQGDADLDRVAELERQTRHDVVAHLRHFAEQAEAHAKGVEGAAGAGGILHLGATSAFVTDNTDVLITRDALRLLARRLATALDALAGFARRHKDLPCLAYTHFQPAQLTTVGKRAGLWIQDLAMDLAEVEHRLETLVCRGAKGTTGTQASYLTLFDGDGGASSASDSSASDSSASDSSASDSSASDSSASNKVRELDRKVAAKLGFDASAVVTGQTYPRKQDSQVLATLAGIAESCHKMGTDLRLLQGVGELSEPFGKAQVGSSAMAYKRNPVRAERMCGLARRVITDSLNGPLNAATQWLERSLDDSSNRRLVLPDAFLGTDAVAGLAGHIAAGLTVRQEVVAARVARELPFMATETILMEASKRGGDRQKLHETLRVHSLAAQEAVATGGENPLLASIAADPSFGLDRQEIDDLVDPQAFTGRSAEQVDELLEEVVAPLLERWEPAGVEAPRV